MIGMPLLVQQSKVGILWKLFCIIMCFPSRPSLYIYMCMPVHNELIEGGRPKMKFCNCTTDQHKQQSTHVYTINSPQVYTIS